MKKYVKMGLGVLAVLAIAFYLYYRPEDAAESVHSLWRVVQRAWHALTVFFMTLFG